MFDRQIKIIISCCIFSIRFGNLKIYIHTTYNYKVSIVTDNGNNRKYYLFFLLEVKIKKEY